MTQSDGTREEAISDMLTGRITAGDFPSAVYLVAERVVVRFSDALGEAVREPAGHSATPETIYDLASLTKPLLTVLPTAMLVERGTVTAVKVGIEDYVRGHGSLTALRQLDGDAHDRRS